MRSGPIRIHASAGRIATRNLAWAEGEGLICGATERKQLAAIRCGSFAAHTYSRASEAVVQLGADLISWLYLFDDRVGESQDLRTMDELRERFSTYEEVIRERGLPAQSNLLHSSLLDLLRRAEELGADSTWMSRFGDSMRDYFEGCALEHPFRRAGRTPDVVDYTAIRSLSVGAYPVFDLIELGSSQILNASEFESVEQLRYLASLLCAWVNDVYSFAKEMADGEPLNIVAAIAQAEGSGPAAALDRAIDLFNTDYDRFDLGVARLLATDPSGAVKSYVAGLRDWVLGNRAWTRLCGRYN